MTWTALLVALAAYAGARLAHRPQPSPEPTERPDVRGAVPR